MNSLIHFKQTEYWNVLIKTVYQMTSGAGQGNVYSSAVASGAFIHSQELGGVGLGRKSIQTQLGIECYIRYADNLFFAVYPHR